MMSPDHGSAPVKDRLKGKVAIVCGAGQTPGSTIGNGKAMALLFGMAGAKVLCVDRDEDRARETVNAILNEGQRAIACQADITKPEDVARIIDTAKDAWGQVDVLVNNVGVGGRDAPVEHLDPDAFDKIMDVNLRGAFLTTKAVIPHMKERQTGSIINISSLASLAGHQMLSYEVSKAAMNRMTTATALSVAKYNVRCNAILPGLMDTPMAISGISKRTGTPEDELRAQRASRVPMGHMGNGWDTAYAALFLASEESRFINGVCLSVDGGQGARIG